MKRFWRLGATLLVLLVLALAWAGVDRCGEWHATPGGLVGLARASGPLSVGAAKVPFDLPYPVTVGGYGPGRHSATSAHAPLYARATVVDVGNQKFALVSLETTFVSDSLLNRLRDGRPFTVWVTATHTHTGPGQFDQRPLAQVVALGPFRRDVEDAIVGAGRRALDEALANLGPAVMSVAHDTHDLTRARTSGSVDQRLTRVRFRAPAGRVVAQWVLFAGHPTLVPQRSDVLDGDYPSRVSAHFETDGSVTSVLQTAGANATLNGTVDDLSAELSRRIERMTDTEDATQVAFGLATNEFALAHPDGSRLAPALFRPFVENALCAGAMMHAEVSALKLGPLSLVAVPTEVSWASARVIEEQSQVTTVVSLANGYEGYLEPQDVVDRGEGESHLQYFGSRFLTQVAEAAQTVSRGAGVPSPPSP